MVRAISKLMLLVKHEGKDCRRGASFLRSEIVLKSSPMASQTSHDHPIEALLHTNDSSVPEHARTC